MGLRACRFVYALLCAASEERTIRQGTEHGKVDGNPMRGRRLTFNYHGHTAQHPCQGEDLPY